MLMTQTKPIRASYRWTLDELVEAQSYHTKITGKRGRWVRFGVLAIMIVVTVQLFVTQDVFNPWLAALVAVAYVGVLINEVVRHPKMIRRSAEKGFDGRPDKNKLIRFIIHDDHIESSTEGLDESRIEWHTIEKVIETPTGFLLYLNQELFLWIPNEAIQPKGDITRLRQIAKAKVGNYQNAAGVAS